MTEYKYKFLTEPGHSQDIYHSFVDLNDTPSTYSGFSEYVVTVWPTESGVQFTNILSIIGFDTTISGVDPSEPHHLTTKSYVDATTSGVNRDAYYAESNGESSTTSDEWQQKVRLTFTPTTSGSYEITFSMMQSHEDTGVLHKARVQIDDSITRYEQWEEFYNFKYEDGAYRTRSGSFVVYLSAQQHTIDLDYCSYVSGKAAYVKEAVIIARRI